MDRKNRITFVMDRSLTRIEKIEVENGSDRYADDAVVGFFAKLFRPSAWWAIRFLVQVNGRPLFIDTRESIS